VTDVPGASRLLLDTHVLLWWLRDTDDLSDDLKERIDTEFEVYVSSVSVWELGIKKASGKLKLPADLSGWIRRSGLSELPISLAHAELAGDLPRIHRDPFDRMLIAQALAERLTLVTRDGLIPQYDVPILKA
jgi:PIN domain nuclease of toxin-antitoxin system